MRWERQAARVGERSAYMVSAGKLKGKITSWTTKVWMEKIIRKRNLRKWDEEMRAALICLFGGLL
jgi:hypothetical protein